MVDTGIATAVWTAGTVSAGEHRLRYWEAGNGAPLLILHGGGGVDLAPAYERLALQGRVICLELPGFGVGAPDPAAPLAFPAVADTVIEATAGLGLDRFALLGVSFGGVTAAWLAARRPELLTRLILVAPAALRDGGPPPRLGPGQIAAARRAHPERGGPQAPPAEVAQRRFAYVDGVLTGAETPRCALPWTAWTSRP